MSDQMIHPCRCPLCGSWGPEGSVCEGAGCEADPYHPYHRWTRREPVIEQEITAD